MAASRKSAAAVRVGSTAIADVIRISSIEAADLSSLDGESDLTAWSTPEFRTVSTPQSRKGLRLERAFWHAFGLISAKLGIKRSTIIADVMRDAGDRQLNATSALRSYAIHALSSELERTQELNAEAGYIGLMLRAPAPAFAVDHNKKLLRVNAEFNHFLRILFAQTGDAVSRHALHINLETPVSQIFDELGQQGDGGEYMMNVVLDTRLRRIRTRMIAVPPHAPTALVGYILP